MFRKTLVTLLAGSGVLIAAPAVSRPEGGIWANSPKANSQPKKDARDEASKEAEAAADTSAAVKTDANGDEAVAKADLDANANADAPAGANSQGAANANLGAVANANSNSALAAGAVASTSLPGLTTGLDVKTSAGASVGKVSQVVTGTDGSIRMVIVTDATGKTHRLMPDQLSISGGVITTTQTEIGG